MESYKKKLFKGASLAEMILMISCAATPPTIAQTGASCRRALSLSECQGKRRGGNGEGEREEVREEGR